MGRIPSSARSLTGTALQVSDDAFAIATAEAMFEAAMNSCESKQMSWRSL